MSTPNITTSSGSCEEMALHYLQRAEKAERDLTALRARCAELEACKNSVTVACATLPNIAEYIAQLERERDEARLKRDEAWVELDFADECAKLLRADLAAAREDTARLDWLDAEHKPKNGLPVAALVVKVNHKRDSSEWANVCGDIRDAIDSARAGGAQP